MFIAFGDIARREIGIAARTAARYIRGDGPEFPCFGKGLRFDGDPSKPRSLRIHHDDAVDFVYRVREHREKR